MMEHTCEQMDNAKYGKYGGAIDEIYINDENEWEMGNGEYGSYPIVVCPFCGVKLEQRLDAIR